MHQRLIRGQRVYGLANTQYKVDFIAHTWFIRNVRQVVYSYSIYSALPGTNLAEV